MNTVNEVCENNTLLIWKSNSLLKTTVYYIIYTMKYFIVVLPLLVNGICLLRVNVLPENFIDNC